MTQDYTDRLTAAEIETLERTAGAAWAAAPLVAATRAARLRTGKRYGTSAERGRLYLELISYRLNAKGQPTGYGRVETLQSGLTEKEAIAFLNGVR